MHMRIHGVHMLLLTLLLALLLLALLLACCRYGGIMRMLFNEQLRIDGLDPDRLAAMRARHRTEISRHAETQRQCCMSERHIAEVSSAPSPPLLSLTPPLSALPLTVGRALQIKGELSSVSEILSAGDADLGALPRCYWRWYCRGRVGACDGEVCCCYGWGEATLEALAATPHTSCDRRRVE
jgi:hypothetical protein